MDLWLVTLILGEFAFVIAILWIVVHYRSRRVQQQAEERGRLLERFGSGRELMEFLDTEAGKKFLKLAALQGSNGGWPNVTKAVMVGVVLFFFGGAFFLIWGVGFPDGEDVMVVPALLLSMGGLGVLAAAAVSGRLLRRHNDLPPAGSPGEDR